MLQKQIKKDIYQMSFFKGFYHQLFILKMIEIPIEEISPIFLCY